MKIIIAFDDGLGGSPAPLSLEAQARETAARLVFDHGVSGALSEAQWVLSALTEPTGAKLSPGEAQDIMGATAAYRRVIEILVAVGHAGRQ